MANYIDIIPEIRHNLFLARIVMTNYTVNSPLVFSFTARRNDGVYKTMTFVYPEEGFDYEENVTIGFFEMGATHIAQIIDVKVNGKEILPQYGERIPEITDEIYVRYNDSLTRFSKYNNINKINLDFQVEDTHNPKTLRVIDESEWGLLTDRVATIEIVLPGHSKPIVTYLGKNQVNIFTSVTLGLNCEDDGWKYLDLPDGVYDITIKGSPSSYNFNRKYMKTDATKLVLDRLWVKASVLCDEQDDALLKKIEEIEYCLSAADANIRLGNTCEANKLLAKAKELLEVAEGCANNGCGSGCK